MCIAMVAHMSFIKIEKYRLFFLLAAIDYPVRSPRSEVSGGLRPDERHVSVDGTWSDGGAESARGEDQTPRSICDRQA